MSDGTGVRIPAGPSAEFMILCTVTGPRRLRRKTHWIFLSMFINQFLKSQNPLLIHPLALNFKLLYCRKEQMGFYSALFWRVKGQPPPPLYSLSFWCPLASLPVIVTLVWPHPPSPHPCFSLSPSLLRSHLCGQTKDSTLSPPGTSFSTCPPRVLNAQITHCHCGNDPHVLVCRPISLVACRTCGVNLFPQEPSWI